MAKFNIAASVLVVSFFVFMAISMGKALPEQAEQMAYDADFTSVTSVEPKFLTPCRKNTTGYEVKGIRNNTKDSITVCATGGWGSYIID